MKKFTKISLITAAVCFCLGLILWGIGVANGGGFKGLAQDFVDGKFTIEYHSGGTKLTSGNVQNLPVELKENMNLKAEVGGAQFRIVDSEDGKFDVESDGLNITWGIDNNDIIINTKNKKFVNTSAGNITVYVPSDYKFKNVDIECGAGNVQSDSLLAEKLKLEIGAGQAVFNGINVESIDVECGAGNIEIGGNVEKGGDVECSMGNISLNLEQPYEYYDYDVECSMGEVNINDNKYSGIDIEKNVKNSQGHKLDIDCSMGQVNISTK